MRLDTSPTDVAVLSTPGCAGTARTIELIHRVARELAIPIRVHEIVVQSPQQASDLRFLGSPTVQVNGLDVDPAARRRVDYGVT
jgi:hypothetical protein